MSEMTKKRRTSPAEIAMYIFCVAVLIAGVVFAVKYVQKTVREEESRQQSIIDESESMLAAANSEDDRLLNVVSDICKKYKYSAHITLNKTVHEPYSSDFDYEESTEDPIKYEINISVQLAPPEKTKDWINFYYFLDELKNIKTLPFIELSVKPYYTDGTSMGSGKESILEYRFYVDEYGLIKLEDGKGSRYIGKKTTAGYRYSLIFCHMRECLRS